MINLKIGNLLVTNKLNLQNDYEKKLTLIKDMILNKSGLGSDFLGWTTWPNDYFKNIEIHKIEAIKQRWKNEKIDTVIVIGIGGSYIGAKAGIDMCTMPFSHKSMNVIFVSGLHSHYNHDLLNDLKNKNWSIVVISKSGTTFETAVNFRIFREALYSQYKADHHTRIIAITDKEHGVLKTLADKSKYETLTIPDDIGGRYSTLTPVGILSMALADININEVLKGWTACLEEFKKEPANINSAMLYAATRNHLFITHHKDIEIFATYENNLRFVSEHYKQIFAESEGKKINSILTTVANNSEDLHSIGQLYQEGIDHCFETSLIYEKANQDVLIPKSSFTNDDNLDYLSGQKLISLNHNIYQAVVSAHTKLAKIPHISIILKDSSPYSFGYLAAWLAIAAATSSYLLDVNPFDQPGVEAYKNEMKKLIK